MDVERRVFALDNIETREGEEGEGSTLAGHAAVFNTKAEIMPGFHEVIAPGAFKSSVKKDDIRALFNHDANIVLGRRSAKTLRLVEDDIGLAVEIDLPDTTQARDLSVSIARGDIDQMSFGFTIAANGGDKVEQMEDGSILRTIKRVNLFDVSPVTFPAYPTTDVALRYIDEFKQMHDELDEAYKLGQQRQHAELRRRIWKARI